jgi:hypothetical protein
MSVSSADAAGIVLSAIEEFAHQLTGVIKRRLRLRAWREMECIVVGGGLRGSDQLRFIGIIVAWLSHIPPANHCRLVGIRAEGAV